MLVKATGDRVKQSLRERGGDSYELFMEGLTDREAFGSVKPF